MTKIQPIEAWANRFGIPLQTAVKIRRLMRLRHRQGTRECNGDPHPQVRDSTDKNACAAAWGADVETTIHQIDVILKPFGIVFDAGTGLWGSVMKDGRYIDDVPSE